MKRKVRTPFKWQLVLLLAWVSTFAHAQGEPEAIAWIQENAILFATVEPGSGFEDLMPLKEVIGDARIVGLGEATHGTSEFFKMKHRLVEFLASEMGFTIFSIEASMPEAYRVNDYVLSGEGDPVQLLAGMYFWTWNTQEVLDMILWMREFNASGQGTVYFTGFDLQTPDVATENVRDFVAKVDPGYLPTLNAAYETVFASVKEAAQAYEQRFTEPHVESPSFSNIFLSWLNAAQEVVDYLEANEARYLEAAAPEEVAWAIQNARIVSQGAESGLSSHASRDQSMADNVSWILEQHPDAKIVLWAHNGHIHKRPLWMGRHLADRYGDDYLSVGFSFYEGSYSARSISLGPLQTNIADPALPHSVDALFYRTGLPQFILDLRNVEETPAAPYLARQQPLRMIGAIALEGLSSYRLSTLGADYDAIIFIAHTTASALLP